MMTNTKLPQSKQVPDKIFVIGLDSTDPDLMEAWMEEGRLPFLKSLVNQGTMTRLSSIACGFSDAPWLSFNTGVRPGKHGCYNFLEVDRDSQAILRSRVEAYPYPLFWELLKDTGKKVGTFDVPKTYPVEGLEGAQISGWGEEYPMLKACSYPESLISEISSRFGTYHHPREILTPRFGFQQVRRYRRLVRAIAQKLQAVRFVMNQTRDWDLFMTSFGEAHYANHLFYHLCQDDHWAYEASLADKLGEALPDIYTQLDSALETLFEDIPEDATVFVLSVHGVSTNYSANHLMPEVLEKLGFQRRATTLSEHETTALKSRISRLRHLLPVAIKDFINDWIVPQSFHDKMHSQAFINSIDWPNTTAFFMPLGHFQAFISINLKGRDPYGTVAPEDYEALCAQITDDLKALINPDTGRPAVQEVIQVAQMCDGERRHHLPDLVICWAEETTINRLSHPEFGSISGEYYGLRKTKHTGNGFLIATGKHINVEAELSNVRDIDIAPTILHLMDQPIPDYMEGSVLSALIDESSRREQNAAKRELATPV